jgi:hypothetical protein
MASAKSVNLRVRPSQWANLCFETGGVLESSSAQLGGTVVQFDYPTFSSNLLATVGGDPSRLQYDSSGIDGDAGLSASILCTLRGESIKAALDKAVNLRQNAYYGKYANQAAVVAQTKAFYDPGLANSKPQRLTTLSNISQNQADLLNAAYVTDGRLSVVKSTTSEIKSKTDSRGETCGTTISDGFNQSTNSGVQNGTSNTFSDSVATDISNVTTSSSSVSTVSDDFTNGTSSGVSVNSSFGSGVVTQFGASISRSDSKGVANQVQAAVNTDYGYRVPSLESQAQNHRAQISLMDEQFSQFMFAQNLPNLDTVFTNELKSIDLDVKRLQIGYLNTILTSPIAGIITGVFKNPGDCVTAGESIFRVEDNATVYVMGTLVYRGLISLGATVTVTTTRFSAGSPTSISGKVVAVRGVRGFDDRWEVVVRCNNLDGGGNQILPLHYHFDYDDTSVTIT